MRKPKTKIMEGDRWYEREIMLMPTMISASVKHAVGASAQNPIRTGEYERIGIRWMKPDGNGNLVPK